jgi:POT family proton-dependent oligopeptide transporter
VGDQFGHRNQHLLERVFAWFYFSINLGAFVSMIVGPILLRNLGPGVAFGVPGVLMALATIVFWAGRNRFAHIPAGGQAFVSDVFSKEGMRVLLRLLGLILFIAMFWALYDQTGSSWVLQGQKLDTNVFGFQLFAEQLQAVNPILVLIFIPLFSYVIYPAIDKVWKLTALRKISIGFFVMVPAFLIPAYIEWRLSNGEQPSILWQVPAYIVLTAAEIFISITGLEFFYAQAPNRMKSLVMSLFMGSVALGNLFTSAVNFGIQNEDGTSRLAGASYFLFFAGLMFITALGFIFYASRYKGQRYVQGDPDPAPRVALDNPVDASAQ